MKKSLVVFATIIALLVVMSIVYWANMKKSEKWLLLHESSAHRYAESLINAKNNNIPTPDEFVDYTIVAKTGYVLFTPHNDRALVVGYFPEGVSESFFAEENLPKLTQMSGSWYSND